MAELLRAGVLVVFAVLTLWLSTVDIRFKRLPDRVLIPGITVTTVLTVLAVWFESTTSSLLWRLVQPLGAAVLLFTIFFALAWFSRGAIGGGDVKLAALIGVVTGYAAGFSGALAAMAIAFVTGGITAAIHLVRARRSRRSERSPTFAFGPYMFVGAWVVLITALTLNR